MRKLKKMINTVFVGLSTLLISATAFASQTTALPWDGPLKTLETSIAGPVLLAVSIIAIVVTGLMLAFGDFGSGGKKILAIVMGISFACGAPSIVVTWFHFSGALI